MDFGLFIAFLNTDGDIEKVFFCWFVQSEVVKDNFSFLFTLLMNIFYTVGSLFKGKSSKFVF